MTVQEKREALYAWARRTYINLVDRARVVKAINSYDDNQLTFVLASINDNQIRA